MENINSIILDTTYVLPLFGIQIDISKNFQKEIKLLWKDGIKEYDIILPSICLIETVFKLLKEYRKQNDFDILDRYQKILPTVLNSHVNIFNPELNPKASLIASIIRHSGHLDFMDCWISGAAVALDGIFLTEDKELKKILGSIPETKAVIIWSWNELIDNIMKKKK